MPPKRSIKQSTGLNQPTLSFQTKLRSSGSAKATAKGTFKTPALRKTDSEASLSSLDRSASPVKEEAKPRGKKETIDLSKSKDDDRPVLDPNGKEWMGLYKEAKAEMGGMAPIHGAGETMVQNILRVFDMTSKYGPYVGITRLERWERAKKWGLAPPEEIKKILLTQQGQDDTVYRESVVYGWV